MPTCLFQKWMGLSFFCAKDLRMKRSSLAHSWKAKFWGNFSALTSIESNSLSYDLCIVSKLSSDLSNSCPSSPMTSSKGKPSQSRRACINFPAKTLLICNQSSVAKPTSRRIDSRLWRRNVGNCWSLAGCAFSRFRGLVAAKNNFLSSALETVEVENLTVAPNLNCRWFNFSKHFAIDSGWRVVAISEKYELE